MQTLQEEKLLHAAKLTTGRTITISLPPDVAHNADKMQKVMAAALGKIGHTGCHSGYDFRYLIEANYAVDAKSLDLRGIGPGF